MNTSPPNPSRTYIVFYIGSNDKSCNRRFNNLYDARDFFDLQDKARITDWKTGDIVDLKGLDY